MKLFLCLPALLWAATTPFASAGSATWSTNPVSGDWNTAANWVPNTVPNRQGDTATFANSNQTVVSFTASGYVDTKSIVFNPGASPFTINLDPGDNYSALTINGPGVINNSGMPQNFVNLTNPAGVAGSILFFNSASAGTLTTYTNQASSGPYFSVGVTELLDQASAGNAVFINQGATVSGGLGAITFFVEHATGAEATFVNQGGTVLGPTGGVTEFFFTASAGNATVIANGGTNGGGGGQIVFGDSSHGGTARIELFGNGFLDLAQHDGALTVGSIEGDGVVELAGHSLSVGSNNLNTTFSGVIEEGSPETSGGTITKVGTGVLTYNGASTFAGATTVAAGTLGGHGTLAGALTIGTGSGAGAVLAPAAGSPTPMTLTTQSPLTFHADGSYTCTLSTKKRQADNVSALGVTIDSGAQFKLQPLAKKRLTAGQIFVILNNTATTPIMGRFLNLPDGATLTSGNNRFQASYTGGDGNDLTLTVQ